MALAENASLQLVLIGSGNVAWHFGHALKNAGIRIVQVISRSYESGQELAGELGTISSTDFSLELPESDFIIVAVKDSVLVEVLQQMHLTEAIILHTSGSLGIDIFRADQKRCGVLYPFQTLTKGMHVDFDKIPMCIEASDNLSLARIKSLAGMISGNVQELTTEQRRILHISGVFLNNFTNHLIAQTVDFLNRNNLDKTLVMPLLEETINKLKQTSPYDAQTGLARRNDFEVIHKHLEILSVEPQLKKLYAMLTDSIIAYYSK